MRSHVQRGKRPPCCHRTGWRDAKRKANHQSWAYVKPPFRREEWCAWLRPQNACGGRWLKRPGAFGGDIVSCPHDLMFSTSGTCVRRSCSHDLMFQHAGHMCAAEDLHALMLSCPSTPGTCVRHLISNYLIPPFLPHALDWLPAGWVLPTAAPSLAHSLAGSLDNFIIWLPSPRGEARCQTISQP